MGHIAKLWAAGMMGRRDGLPNAGAAARKTQLPQKTTASPVPIQPHHCAGLCPIVLAPQAPVAVGPVAAVIRLSWW
jgi:hypothetical protein